MKAKLYKNSRVEIFMRMNKNIWFDTLKYQLQEEELWYIIEKNSSEDFSININTSLSIESNTATHSNDALFLSSKIKFYEERLTEYNRDNAKVKSMIIEIISIDDYERFRDEDDNVEHAQKW